VDAIESHQKGSKVDAGILALRRYEVEPMIGNRSFDEVMIVNPSEPNGGGRLMRFHYGQLPEIGYYAEPQDYGYYAEDPYLAQGYAYGEVDPYGYYAETPEVYGYGEPDIYGQYEPVGYFAEEPYLAEEIPYGETDPYGEVDPYGYYAEQPEMYGWGEPDVYGQYEPMGYYGEEPYLSEEIPYGETEPYGYYAQSPEMYGYGEPDISGYVRDTAPTFNAGCPLPTNVSGFGEAQPFEGYVTPTEVSPSCSNFTPQPGATASVPETFKPLW
jgi:hypothetical protein